MLEALIYVSAANAPLNDGDIQDILAVAGRNNPAEGLTGALIFSGSIFVQMLEGTPINLDDMMRRIVADDRHNAVVVLARDSIQRRHFDGWSMAYRQIEGLVADELHRQIGWDNTIKKLLDSVIEQQSMESLAAVMEETFKNLKY